MLFRIRQHTACHAVGQNAYVLIISSGFYAFEKNSVYYIV